MSRVPKDYTSLPSNLPVPMDDGACEHLLGLIIPKGVKLLSTSNNRLVDVSEASKESRSKVVFFFYPRSGKPGEPLPKGWDDIAGARGCTPESCSYRDLYTEFKLLGSEIYGISTQSAEDQKEFAERSKIPYQILSDSNLQLTQALRLPTFTVPEVSTPLIKRLTIVFDEEGRIEKVFYPVFPPDKNAEEVLSYLKSKSEHGSPH